MSIQIWLPEQHPQRWIEINERCINGDSATKHKDALIAAIENREWSCHQWIAGRDEPIYEWYFESPPSTEEKSAYSSDEIVEWLTDIIEDLAKETDS